MGIFDKIKDAMQRRKEKKSEQKELKAELELEEIAVEFNKEIAEIYSQINEVDSEKRAVLAERADTCVKRYLGLVDRVKSEIDSAQRVYESYRDDDEIIAHLSDYEMERELNDLMTKVIKKEISAKELNAAFKAAVELKSVFDGEQNFVDERKIEEVLNGAKSVSEIEATASVDAKKHHAKYFAKDESIFNSEMLSFIGKIASAVTIAQGAVEGDPAKAVAGAALYSANSKINREAVAKKQKSEENASEHEQDSRQKGE